MLSFSGLVMLCAAPFPLPRYPLADSATGEFLPVATTRPETILGDTAVAVNPADERFTAFVGRQVVVPMSGGRTIPVIADDYVDMEFGTGALKITPGGGWMPLRWRVLVVNQNCLYNWHRFSNAIGKMLCCAH